VSAVEDHLDETEVSALQSLIGKRLAIRATSGSIRDEGLLINDALIQAWPAEDSRTSSRQTIVGLSGSIEECTGGIWISLEIQSSIECQLVREKLVNEIEAKRQLVPGFDIWPSQKAIVTDVEIFEELLILSSDDGESTVSTDSRININFSEGDSIGMEAGAAGWGYVAIVRGRSRPWNLDSQKLKLRRRLS
jgi:hypothetical protein